MKLSYLSVLGIQKKTPYNRNILVVLSCFFGRTRTTNPTTRTLLQPHVSIILKNNWKEN